MADLLVHKGKTSKLLRFFVQDTRQSDGSGLKSLVFNSAGLSAYYIREGDASATAITLATMTLGTWATGGFVLVDDTNMPGYYELGIPNAAIASSAGVDSVVIMLKGAANMAVAIKELQLSDFDPNDAVRAGLTALPNVASGSAGAIPTTGTGANQLSVSSGLVTLAAVTHTGAVIPTVTTVTGSVGSVTGAVGSVTGAVGSVTGNVGGNVVGSVASVTGAVGSVTGAVGSVTGAVGSVTGNVGGNVVGSVASVTGAVGSVTAGVTVTTNNDKTGYALTAGERTSIATAVQGTTLAELTQAQPPTTPTLAQALMLPYMALRNQRVTDGTALFDYIYNAAGVVVCKAAIADTGGAGGVFTRSQTVTGP